MTTWSGESGCLHTALYSQLSKFEGRIFSKARDRFSLLVHSLSPVKNSTWCEMQMCNTYFTFYRNGVKNCVVSQHCTLERITASWHTNEEFLKRWIKKLSTYDEKSTGKLELHWSFSNNESNITHSDVTKIWLPLGSTSKKRTRSLKWKQSTGNKNILF